ncbi:protein-(glutamine-N5) methyltransferase, release factor-specific [Marinobacterium aestuarii]|uniref:Release factor glutamine methyltransferase n=1 Tax=Marinobacterium aestuarii TaxID=1821621 RepID=A0A1A9F3D4_9GAMM|nr:peptide chain release factor N(5)-glutamine methyltransferase [Marinobacterium aestuarii]ANG64371.1 protein-(glutamine-N5) methyltransferase, release factor-specific [Marinobacterium aestuarii]
MNNARSHESAQVSLTIAKVLQSAAQLVDSDSPRLDLELLLCHLLDCGRTYLFTHPERVLSVQQAADFDALLQRRLAGEPVAHLTGRRGFWTLDLEVSADTLIPRPDTETLVEQALELLPDGDFRVADLGTGTGAIALALASERPGWTLQGCDRVAGAVALAQRNAKRLGLSNARFVQGSWFEPLDGRFAMIVSNPPYIDPADPHLGLGDVRFEPRSALVADDKGLADIRHIAKGARIVLEQGGWLLFEHGYDQAEAVRTLLDELGYCDTATRPDLGGRDRVTLGRWLQEPARSD